MIGKKFLLAALALCLLSPAGSKADGAKVGSEFSYTSQAGVFHIVLTQYFPPNVTLDDTRKDFQDSDLQVDVSRFVAHMYKSPNNSDAPQFQVKTSSHMISFVYTTNACSQAHDDAKWWQSCSITNSFINRQVFKNAYGKSSASCAQQAGQVVCQFRIEGEPESIGSKTPKHLAGEGAMESLHDLTAIYMILSGTAHDASDAKNQILKTDFGRSIDQIPVDVDAHPGNDVTITGSSTGSAPSHQLSLR